MSLHLDYANENLRDAWIAPTNDPAAIKALVIGGRALVRSGRDLERLAEQVQQLQREVALLPSPALDDSDGSSALKQVRDVMITATAECKRCEGTGTAYDPDRFGWNKLLAGDTTTLGDRVMARIEARELDEEPPDEGPCPDCDASGQQSVTLAFTEYESLRRTEADMLVDLEDRLVDVNHVRPPQRGFAAPRARHGWGRSTRALWCRVLIEGYLLVVGFAGCHRGCNH
jgi:hypothetical protein